MSMTIARLPVFYKQRDLQFYPPWSYSLPTFIIKIPISFIEAFVWVVFTYYIIGLDPNVGRFFKQYILLVIINQMGSALYRCIAAMGRSLVVARKFGSFSLLILFALGGFVLSRDNVKVWWIWGYWLLPVMYGMNAIAVNEFLGHQWNRVLPNTTEPLGIITLKSRGFFPYASWYWIGVGALLGFILLFNCCFTLALSLLNPIGKPQAVITEESYKGRNKGSIDQGSFKGRGDHIRRNSPCSSTTAEYNGQADHNKRK